MIQFVVVIRLDAPALMQGLSRSTLNIAGKKVLASALMLVVSVSMLAASPTVAPSTPPNPSASSTTHLAATLTASTLRKNAPAAVSSPSVELPDGPAVIAFLSKTIEWYRHLGIEERLVTDPAEMLFLADDRQMADEVLDLSFEFGKAGAQLLAAGAVNSSTVPAESKPQNLAGADDLAASAADSDTEVKAAQDRLKALQAQSATASGRRRRELVQQIAAAQSELDLAEARGEALHTVLEFERGNFHQEAGASASGLAGQIEELEKAAPETARSAKAPAATSAATSAPPSSNEGGVIGILEDLFALNRKVAALNETTDLTNSLAQSVQRWRAPLIAELRAIDRQGDALAKASAGDVEALRARKAAFEALIERHKLVSAAAIPLSKESVILTLYVENLARWRTTIERQSSLQLRHLLVRLAVLVVLLMSIFGAASLWRRFTFRYVQDSRRRYQFLQARRIVLGIVVTIVILVNFANEIGSFATVMGFAAAGIAVALQNVILSLAGYFFLIGKFGIKVGDRVQVSGVSGDVVDIGLVKLSLMELGGSGGNDRQPTGRVVVFSNAIVFQPSGNFFKQIPGTNFVWNEVTLTLSPDCDYRLAEKRLLEAVDEVFARYRENIQRQYLEAERSLNIAVDAPKAQSRLVLNQNGLQLTIRYPAETRNSVQIADEVSRRLLDAITREPGLKLVTTGTPNIQPAPPAPDSEDGAAPADKDAAAKTPA